MIRQWQPFLIHLKPHISGLGMVLGLGIFGVGLTALQPWPLKFIIDNVLSGEPLPAVVNWIVPSAGDVSSIVILGFLSLSLLLLFMASQLLQLLKGFIESGLSAQIQYSLGRDVFDHLQALSLTYHGRASKGDLVRRIVTDTNCISTLVSGVLLPAIISSLALIVLFTIMLQLNALLTLLAALVALPMFALMYKFSSRMTELAHQHQELEGQLWSVAEQSLTALPLVQAFDRSESESARFRGTANRSIGAYLKTIFAQLQFKFGVEGSQALGVALIIGFGGFAAISGAITVGTLVVFLSYLASLYAPLNALVYLSATLSIAAGSARRVASVLNTDERVEDERTAVPLLPTAANQGRSIKFENVVFGYAPRTPVLKGISLELKPNEVTALVGRTGAGKSSLASLIPRLFDPWQGRILFDGQDIRSATIESVRAEVSYVLQDPFLLPLSISENIAYGRPSSSREEIVEAARTANIHDFIVGLEHGYDTLIGERGATLSGGQRQRISIARAILKNAPILILDEPTSALDVGTEGYVMEAISNLISSKTTLLIAHRLSTARTADRIVVLDDGQIAEGGTHEELLRLGGIYKEMLQGTQEGSERESNLSVLEGTSP